MNVVCACGRDIFSYCSVGGVLLGGDWEFIAWDGSPKLTYLTVTLDGPIRQVEPNDAGGCCFVYSSTVSRLPHDTSYVLRQR